MRDQESVNADEPPDGPVLTIPYTNWRGVFAMRRVIPAGAPFFGPTEWHPEPQWLLPVWDVEREGIRDYALASIGYPPPPLQAAK